MAIKGGFSRSPDDLIPEARDQWNALLVAWMASPLSKKYGKPIITMSRRTKECQLALIAQGRESLASVNAKRKVAGMPPLLKPQENVKVTWIKPEAVDTAPHCRGIAIDFFLDSNADGKVDSKDWNEDDGFIAFGKFAKSKGWIWGGNMSVGGDFRTQNDLPHIQWGY
jgi:hypothetical protein